MNSRREFPFIGIWNVFRKHIFRYSLNELDHVVVVFGIIRSLLALIGLHVTKHDA